MVEYRSWSQAGEMDRCPYAYYLSRVERVWRQPAAWLPMGTAVHEAAEKWEASDRSASDVVAVAWFKEAYMRETDRYLAKTPDPSRWAASGPYKGPEDIERRYEVGQEHVRKYTKWYREHPDQRPWILPDGRKAVELPFKIFLDGVEVRGFIDRIDQRPDGSLVVVDNKTGQKPGDVGQLKLYGVAVEDHLAFRGLTGKVSVGEFFMTRTGKPTVPYDLAQVTRIEMAERFRKIDDQIRAGEFPPKPSAENCRRCDVRFSCKFREG